MPGANLPELTREITSIPRDASEYPHRPMDGLSDTRLELKEACSQDWNDFKLQRRDVTSDTEERSSLRKLTFSIHLISIIAACRFTIVACLLNISNGLLVKIKCYLSTFYIPVFQIQREIIREFMELKNLITQVIKS